MKKVLFPLILLLIGSTVKAQTTYSRYDVNHDGKVDISDVTVLVDALLGKINYPVTSVSLSESSVVTFVGEPFRLYATIQPEDADMPKVIWTSSDESIAKVSSGGYVTPLKWGNVTITATAADGCGASAACKVEVNVRPEEVDLGLSVKWATFNLGAPSPYSAGGYYEWAGTEAKYEFTSEGSFESTVNTSASGSNLPSKNCITYTDSSLGSNQKKFPELYDAAAQKWGSEWRVPTYGEWSELRTECTWEWETIEGMPGFKVTSPNGNSIFLPAIGYYYGTKQSYWQTGALYMTSTLCSDTSYAYALFFSKTQKYFASIDRTLGFPIRPVRSK